ncbi:MAG: diguanylate cyclase [Desulfobacterales bacterium]|nr:diguanylate cyclase [Desulfobacterales bacterium]MDX2510767.1 diguanylate cyclase [Desulfobacterales bacterium]
MKGSYPILLVEDNPISRKMLEKILINEGFKVTSVENGKEALALFREHFFPIVLTDWLMPEMDGSELCKAIRNEKQEGYVYIVLLTAKDSKDDIISGLESGADDYLTKPANHAELLARLKNGLRILDLEKSLKSANEEIRILSITDPLTGIYNRGYLNERLPQEIKRSLRYKRPLSLILCDIDHFKSVNDKFGHVAGDTILKGFVGCISASIRDQIDWSARYGGEEFLVVLPETDFLGARHLAERLRAVVSEKYHTIGDEEVRITASFGVSGFSPDMLKKNLLVDDILNHVDKYLYKAKNGGRNRVEGAQLQ